MYLDMPDHRAYQNLVESMYASHPVRIDIGGTVESIQKIDRDLLEKCYRMFYNPANMVLLVAGDLDPERVFAQVDGLLAPGKFQARGPIARHCADEPPGVKERVVRGEMDLSRPRVLVGFKDLDGGGAKALERELESSVVLDLVFGRGGEFYTRAYESGLIDDSFSFSYNSDDPFGFSLIGGETDEPERLAEEVLLELHKAKEGKLRAGDVERSKRKRLGRFIRSFDSPDGCAFLVMGCAQRGIDLFAVPQVISKMAPKALERRLASHFDERNYAVSILMPKKAVTS